MEVGKNQKTREGWDAAFKAMAGNGDDTPVIDDKEISHSWDEEEWQKIDITTS